MKRAPWRVIQWGTGEGVDRVETHLTIDNRELKFKSSLADQTPLLTMKASARFTIEELSEYAKIIVDRLNVEEVVEELQR